MLCAGWKHLLLIILWIPDAVTVVDLLRLLYIVKEKDINVPSVLLVILFLKNFSHSSLDKLVGVKSSTLWQTGWFGGHHTC